MDIIYHYPPELLNLLVDTIPLLCRSKKDVVVFFRGAGTPRELLSDLESRIHTDPDNIHKYEIARTALTRLNERGETTLRERREILKRVVEFEEFSTCWPDDQLKAKGLVAEIRRVVDVKDSFTRMRQEREAERKAHAEKYKAKVRQAREKKEQVRAVKDELFALFSETDPHARGRRLERVLNDLFEVSGILIRESFTRVEVEEDGVLEQIDGVVELDGEVYLVEMKWLSRSVSVADVSHHLVRVFSRGSSRGLFISATEFSTAAMKTCKEVLQQQVVILCLLQEIVRLLEREGKLKDLIKEKVRRAIVDKQPYHQVKAG